MYKITINVNDTNLTFEVVEREQKQYLRKRLNTIAKRTRSHSKAFIHKNGITKDFKLNIDNNNYMTIHYIERYKQSKDSLLNIFSIRTNDMSTLKYGKVTIENESGTTEYTLDNLYMGLITFGKKGRSRISKRVFTMQLDDTLRVEVEGNSLYFEIYKEREKYTWKLIN